MRVTRPADSISKQLAAYGLSILGTAVAEPGDNLPEAAPGKPARAIVLAGNAGSAFWPHFTASREFSDGLRDPLNRWSARVLRKIAEANSCGVVFPFEGPPYWPFQQWGLRTGTLSQSPLGVLAHTEYGLWFAFRGAFLLSEALQAPDDPAGGPCENCVEKPCLDACPADALTRAHGYEPGTCRAHVAGAGRETCGGIGCLVRHACPFGQDYAYAPEQAAFHMRAFTGAD
jgi:hypothetical protein